MRFGYTIFYVDDIAATLSFYEQAFGFKRALLVENEYAELDTGGTRLAFAPRKNAANLHGLELADTRVTPPMEIGLVTDDVEAAFAKALAAGAVKVKAPAKKPWGQIVAYVKDKDGFLIEICTPVEQP